MKIVIAYYSGHHGNTKKILDAIKERWNVDLIDVTECKKTDLSGYDVIGLASGTYFNRFSMELIEFVKNNLLGKKDVFLINTYGLKGASKNEMERIIADKSCHLLGTYGCRGFDTFGPLKLIGGIAKGRPNENDLIGAVEFFKKIVENKKELIEKQQQ